MHDSERELGGGSRDWFARDTDLNPLRSRPRYHRMIARLASSSTAGADDTD